VRITEQEENKMAEEKKIINPTDEEIEENEDVEDQDDNKADSGNSGDDKSGKDDKGSKSGKTFTQDQVTRMMTREKNQGRNAAYKELGIDPKDTKMVNMFKAFVESQKTDEQKASEAEAEKQSKMDEAEKRAQVAEAKAEAMMLGVKTQYVEDVVTLALAKMTEGSDLKTIIGEFKTKYPVWFGESSEEDDKGKDSKGKAGQKGTGSSVKNSDKEKKGSENKGLGARLAAQRKTSKKSSYWNSNK
jgi:hypothetical protein